MLLWQVMLSKVSLFSLGVIISLLFFCPSIVKAEGVSFDLSDSSNYSISINGVDGEFYTGSATFGKLVDINQDGMKELLVSVPYNNSNISFLYAVPQATILSHLASGTDIDLSDPSSYLVKFTIGDYRSASSGSIVFDDLDGDGYEDIIVNEWSGDVGGADTGSVFIIYSDLLTGITGTGNTYNLTASGNYTIRFNGATAQGRLSTVSIPTDLNNSGKKDLVLGAPRANNFRGEIFVIFDDIFGSIAKTSTNNHISLANPSNYKVKYHNTIANASLGIPHTQGPAIRFGIAELDSDEYPELLFRESALSGDYAGATLIIRGADLNALTGNGHTLDTSTPSSYWIKYLSTGPEASCSRAYALEFNSYGPTLFIECKYGNSIDYRGAIYMIPAEYFNTLTGTGHNLELSEGTTYTLRLDGAFVYDPDDGRYGMYFHDFGDFDNDGLTDILFGNYSETPQSTQQLIYGKELEGLATSGNVVDLRTVTFFIPSWVVPAEYSYAFFADFNNDGMLDLVFDDHAYGSDKGRLFIVMNSQKPSITLDAIPSVISTNQVSISGVVSQQLAFSNFNHPNLYKIYYSLDDGPLQLLDCSDGSCDSQDEEFSETLGGLTEGQHSLVVYAQNSFGVLGATSQQVFTYVIPATPTPTQLPTPTPTPGVVSPPSFITLGKIGNLTVIDGLYTYYYTSGKNLTFSGITSPNAYVTLTIQSDPVTCTTQADGEGNWGCTFNEEIPNGYHTLAVSAYYEGSNVISTEKYTLGIGVGLAEAGSPAVLSVLAGGLMLVGGVALTLRRKKH